MRVVASAGLSVLKFGSSLLADADGYRAVATELLREVGGGRRVLAVVSARRGVTDTLESEARALCGEGGSDLEARLLGTGEEASAALLALAGRRLGLRAAALSAGELSLRTEGPADDAIPVGLAGDTLRDVLNAHDVTIVPGFVGRDAADRPTLLGRGGSDYTALFLGAWLGAEEIRLVKDVDGVFPCDPRSPSATTSDALPSATWDEVAALGNGVVQSKALAFAASRGLAFRVTGLGGRGTWVGRDRSVRRLPVAVLGATGLVGQQVVRLLADHPWLEIAELVGSDRSAGRSYHEAVTWRVGGSMPKGVRDMPVRGVEEDVSAPVVLSALPSSVAEALEPRLAGEGRLVSSNAASHRMRSDIPLVIPEVNAGALASVGRQSWHDVGGALVTNPNCVVAGLGLVLAPLQRKWGITDVTVTTLQALSGAGARGPHAVDLVGNVVPFIPGEEEKIAAETRKILGIDASIAVAVTRVPVMDGHTAHVFLRLGSEADGAAVADALRAFRSSPEVAGLPSIPTRPLRLLDDVDRPQPLRDLQTGNGMTVSVGRVRQVDGGRIALTMVVHNTIRGAAGASVANAELCLARGWRPVRPVTRGGRAYRPSPPLPEPGCSGVAR